MTSEPSQATGSRPTSVIPDANDAGAGGLDQRDLPAPATLQFGMNGQAGVQREAWRLFLQTHARVLARLEEDLERQTGLPLSWYDVLAHLRSAPDRRLRLQDLARSVVISKSGLTRRIDRMEEAGLVRRCGCQEDKRGAFAVLTDEGARAVERAMPVHLADVERHVLRHLTDTEAEVLIAAFGRILTSVDESALATADA